MKNTPAKNKELCKNCDACCRYVAVQIDEPEDNDDYQNIIWQLLHENVNVFIDWDNDWYLEFVTPCEKLNQETGLCSDYDNRPSVCSNYSQEECPYHTQAAAEKKYFKTADEFKKYWKKKK